MNKSFIKVGILTLTFSITHISFGMLTDDHKDATFNQNVQGCREIQKNDQELAKKYLLALYRGNKQQAEQIVRDNPNRPLFYIYPSAKHYCNHSSGWEFVQCDGFLNGSSELCSYAEIHECHKATEKQMKQLYGNVPYQWHLFVGSKLDFACLSGNIDHIGREIDQLNKWSFDGRVCDDETIFVTAFAISAHENNKNACKLICKAVNKKTGFANHNRFYSRVTLLLKDKPDISKETKELYDAVHQTKREIYLKEYAKNGATYHPKYYDVTTWWDKKI